MAGEEESAVLVEEAKETNPFIHQRTKDLSVYEWIKIVLMTLCMIPLVRLLLIFILVLFGALWAKLCLIGWRQRPAGASADVPMGACRRAMLAPLRLVFRLVLHCAGFYWICSKRPAAPQPPAPILAVNHIGVFDSLYFIVWNFPMIVAKDDVGRWPLIGTIVQAMQPILVPRSTDKTGASGRQVVGKTITERVQSGMFPPLLIFPEGTTTSGKALITFKTGAFRPGVPVQPVCIRYPALWHQHGWGPHTHTAWLLWRTLCQVVNFMTVEYLPVHVPTAAEQADPELFASNVRAAMAAALRVPVTRHSVDDVLLMHEAQKHDVELPEEMRMTELQHDLRVDLSSVASLMKRFRALDRKHDHGIDVEEFAAGMRLPLDAHTRRIFKMLDVNQDGTIDFREFVLGMLFATPPDAASVRKKIELAFHIFDQDGSLAISRREFRRILHRASPDRAPTELEALETKVFATFDRDTDGQLTLEEFTAAAERHPDLLQIAQSALTSPHGLVFPTLSAPLPPPSTYGTAALAAHAVATQAAVGPHAPAPADAASALRLTVAVPAAADVPGAAPASP